MGGKGLAGMEELLVGTVILLAALTQSLTGFGFGLVSMPILVGIVEVTVAAPLVALISIILNGVMWMYHRRTFDWSAVSKLLVSAIASIPLGILALQHLPEALILTILGIVLVGYGTYSWVNWQLPEVKSPNWAFGFGFLSGLLAGAYNTGGPPVVIYANCRRWSPQAFRSNLPGFFWVHAILVTLGHGWQHNLTPTVWKLFFLALMPLGLGIIGGTWLAKYINPPIFKRIVLLLLIILGVRLLVR